MYVRVPQEKCPDCGVKIGESHQGGCDIEHCPACGQQAIIHGSSGPGDRDDECKGLPDKGTVWTGVFPGTDEAAALGLFTRWDETKKQWIQCSTSEPNARPDIGGYHEHQAMERSKANNKAWERFGKFPPLRSKT